MPDWTIFDVRERGAGAHFSGYAVHDALGMRLGYVTGWVVDAGAQVQMLKVSVTEWDGTSDYLIPVGAVTLVSDMRSIVQLRDVTKRSIGRLCYRYKGELPEARLLVSLQRHFRAPRASVIERLAGAAAQASSQDASLSWMRLSEIEAPRREGRA